VKLEKRLDLMMAVTMGNAMVDNLAEMTVVHMAEKLVRMKADKTVEMMVGLEAGKKAEL